MTANTNPLPQLDEQSAHVPTRLGRLHVRTVGDGPTTVLWSSMFVDSHTWDAMIPLLPSTRRYLLVDPPGLGLSEPLRINTDMPGAAAAALDLLAAVGAGPVDWVGNAFGGHVGFELATHPGVLRSLVAVSSPAEPISPALRFQIRMLLPVLRWFGPIGPVAHSVVTAMLTDASASRTDVQRVVTDSLGRPSRASLAAAVRSFILARVDVTRLGLIDVPTLFVASDDRGDWTPEAAAASARLLCTAAQVRTVAGARTLIPLEQPELLAAEVRRFWGTL